MQLELSDDHVVAICEVLIDHRVEADYSERYNESD